MQCRATYGELATPVTHIRWFPAHTSVKASSHPNRNETADAAARELSNGEAPPRSSPADGYPETEQEPLASYGKYYSGTGSAGDSSRPPHPKLTRAEAVLYRQLQTHSVITPVLARHVCPEVYESVLCSVCARTNATLAHLLWGCERHSLEADGATRLPEDITYAMNSNEHEVQLRTIQRLEAALAGQKRREASSGGRRVNTRTPTTHRPRRRPRGTASGTT